MKNKVFVFSLVVTCSMICFRCSEDDAPKSGLREIISFKFPALNPEVIGVINDSEKKISLAVGHGTDVTALIPEIEVSDRATISPTSGEEQDFSAPVTYTVIAEDGSMQEYLVTVTQESVCLPTTLPGEESYLKITYNHHHDAGMHTIDQIEYLDFDAPEPGRYTSEFGYTGAKLSRIDNLTDNQIESYITFEYHDGKIVENHFNKTVGGDFEKYMYYLYYLQSGEITSRAYHDKFFGYKMLDSLVLTYNATGNITHADGYNSDKVKTYTVDYEFDNKPNPYKLAGISEADNEFYTPSSLSVNNILKLTYRDLAPSEEVEITSYTYDAAGNPLTRNSSWDGAVRNLAYTCH